MTSKILKIALVGRTNAGKSTLINRIVGEKISIQNKKINTTQVTIMGVKNIKKTQLIFYDTPGSNFLKSLNKQSRNLKTNLWSGIDESDIIFYLIDSKTANVKFLFEQIDKLQEVKKKIIVIFNKIDLISNKQVLPLISNLNKNFQIDSFFTISAIQNIGIEDLLDYIQKYSYVSKWIFKDDEITNKDDIFIVGELLRETMLTYLHKEIPYNVNIETSNFKILKNNDIKIKQKIIINQLRYKKIILGKKGEMIKKIREDSQKKMSQIFNAKIHLYLEILKCMIEYKERGILIFSKISSENNLYLKILTQKDEIITGLSFGGSTKKKKNIFQIGYFLNIVIKNKNKNFPNSISAELSKPYYHNIFNDKYKLHGLLALSIFVKYINYRRSKSCRFI